MRYVLDGKKIARLRTKAKMSLGDAARAGSMSKTAWTRLEDSLPVIARIALGAEKALSVPIEDLEIDRIVPLFDAPQLDNRALRQNLSEAMQHDMRRDYEAAQMIFDRVLARLGPKDERHRSELRLIKATSLDQGGEHERAAKELQSLRAACKSTTRLGWRIRYHIAINERRLGNLDEAERMLLSLLNGRHRKLLKRQFEGSLLHQLGVVSADRAARNKKHRKASLREARERFERALAAWDRSSPFEKFAGGHRRGFTHRRLAATLQQLGQQDAARAQWFRAVAVLSWYHHAQFVEDTIAEYEALDTSGTTSLRVR